MLTQNRQKNRRSKNGQDKQKSSTVDRTGNKLKQSNFEWGHIGIEVCQVT